MDDIHGIGRYAWESTEETRIIKNPNQVFEKSKSKIKAISSEEQSPNVFGTIGSDLSKLLLMGIPKEAQLLPEDCSTNNKPLMSDIHKCARIPISKKGNPEKRYFHRTIQEHDIRSKASRAKLVDHTGTLLNHYALSQHTHSSEHPLLREIAPHLFRESQIPYAAPPSPSPSPPPPSLRPIRSQLEFHNTAQESQAAYTYGVLKLPIQQSSIKLVPVDSTLSDFHARSRLSERPCN